MTKTARLLQEIQVAFVNSNTDFFSSIDTLLYRRMSYELMIRYWSDAAKNPSATKKHIALVHHMIAHACGGTKRLGVSPHQRAMEQPALAGSSTL